MKNSKRRGISLLLVVASFCMLLACSDYSEQAPSTPVWAIQPTFASAKRFANQAAFVIDTTGNGYFIDLDGNAFYQELEIDSSRYFEGYKPDKISFGEDISFSGGVIQDLTTSNGEKKVCRSGVVIGTAATDGIRGQPIRIGDLYLQAVEADTEGLDFLYGLMNEQRAWIEAPVYFKYDLLPGGYYTLSNGSSSPYILLVSPDGTCTKISGYWEEGSGEISQSDQDNPVFAFHDFSGKYRYFDKSGQLILRTSYEDCQHFSEGYAAVREKTKYGYMDQSGDLVIQPQFEDATGFSEGLAAVCLEGQETYSVIDKAGNVIFHTPYTYLGMFYNHYAICSESENNDFGIVNTQGQPVLDPKYDYITRSEDIYLIRDKGKWGYFIPATDILVAPQFDEISAYDKDIAIVQDGNKYGLLNIATGEYICSPRYGMLEYWGENIYVGISHRGYDLIAENGEILLHLGNEYSLDMKNGFHNGVAPVLLDGKWGYIANPLVFSAWESTALSRAQKLGMGDVYGANDISGEKFYEVISFYIERLAQLNGRLPLSGEMLENIHVRFADILSKETITRQEASEILQSISECYGLPTKFFENYCYDKDVVHAEYQDAVAYISSIGIINLENGYFEPDKPVGKVEAISILERLFEELLDAQDDLLWYVGDNAVEIKGNTWFALNTH